MATSENKSVYQFDDDSLLKFAKAIANAVSVRYIDTESLSATIIKEAIRDPRIFPAISQESASVIKCYGGNALFSDDEVPTDDIIGRAVIIDDRGFYAFATGDPSETVVGVVAGVGDALETIINEYGVTIGESSPDNPSVSESGTEEEENSPIVEEETEGVSPDDGETMVEEDVEESGDPIDYDGDVPVEEGVEDSGTLELAVNLTISLAVMGEVLVRCEEEVDDGSYVKPSSGGVFIHSDDPTNYKVLYTSDATYVRVFMSPNGSGAIEISGVVSKNGSPVNGITVDLNPTEEV